MTISYINYECLILNFLILVSVTHTESANVALSLFQAQTNYYNIVLADFRMPEMDIYKFVEELRCQQMDIPIICKLDHFSTYYILSLFYIFIYVYM